jgi:hypothetical protein
MTRVVVDEILRTKLHNFLEPIELCDESGQVVGRVFPSPDEIEPTKEMGFRIVGCLIGGASIGGVFAGFVGALVGALAGLATAGLAMYPSEK